MKMGGGGNSEKTGWGSFFYKKIFVKTSKQIFAKNMAYKTYLWTGNFTWISMYKYVHVAVRITGTGTSLH
jgi:hypothetical protein